jgi:hypothetical protein
MSAVIDSLAKHLQERVRKAEPEVARLQQRLDAVEAAVRELLTMRREVSPGSPHKYLPDTDAARAALNRAEDLVQQG